MDPAYYHLSYFHGYRMWVYRPDIAETYDRHHRDLVEDETNHDIKAALLALIDQNSLKDYPRPSDYVGTEWVWKNHVARFRETGEEAVPRDSGIEPPHYTLGHWHQYRAWAHRPRAALAYDELHERLARDTQDDAIKREIVEHIAAHGLRRGPISHDLSHDELKTNIARLKRAYRARLDGRDESGFGRTFLFGSA